MQCPKPNCESASQATVGTCKDIAGEVTGYIILCMECGETWINWNTDAQSMVS